MTTEKLYRLMTFVSFGQDSTAWLARNPEQVHAAYMGSTSNNALGAAMGFADQAGMVDLATYNGDLETLLPEVHEQDRNAVRALLTNRAIAIIGGGATA